MKKNDDDVIRVKTLVEKQDSNTRCGFCPCKFNADDENRWDVYICYVASEIEPSAFMVCKDCRMTSTVDMNSKTPMLMQYADDDRWYTVDDYQPLNY